ncbi:hypothetical protein PTSG_12971 [Salpingoeca rosetta]|uniref:Uncharacterized protein n=1 Tax=Salpingoeca rosetta (strain ATCC 50818 / BSB-021) TaxID=946362 RepID=F2UNQ0_SALR5|nr:uncharacterized protein PTSG_12971 [Salpingoeca rosetta]EGD79255.1 hypothetical protein PTSG_12971 [Salpingoeca rosetta]|eukprot:XP_004989340.1 hypothetical protein PTSG_12971 [Salpingoeca rosetta]
MASPHRSFWDVSVELRISEAKNLGTSKDQNDAMSPYCLVEVDDEEVARTSTKWQTFNPFFGETFHIAMPHNFSVMSISVCDQTKGTKLGLMYLNRATLFKSLSSDGHKEAWFPLLKPVPVIEVQGELFVELLLTSTPYGSKRLDVTVVRARDIFHKGFSGKCEPYFELSFDGDTRTSEKKRGARFPLWDQSFSFERKTLPDSFTITVFDGTKKAGQSLLGQASITLDHLEPGLRHPQWHRLEPRVEDYDGNTSGNGTIRVFAQLTHQLIMPISAYHPLFSYLLSDIGRPDVATRGWLGLLQSLVADGTIDRDGTASALMLALNTDDAVSCLKALTIDLISKSDNSATLFRSNSLASKCADHFMKIVGLPYLHETLKEIIDDIFYEKKDCEIDPSKMSSSSPSVIKRHATDLTRYLERILDRIFSSCARCPWPMRAVFSNIRSAVEQNEALASSTSGDDSSTPYTAVSGFVFLRFFAPAVLSPKLFGMREELADATTARTLTLLAKALQTIGNLGSSNFAVKEQYMAPLGPVIDKNVPRVKAFIDELCRVSAIAAHAKESVQMDAGSDTLIAASAKMPVLEPGAKSFKKKIVSLTRHMLMWQKSPSETPARLLLKDVINVERMEPNTFDKKNLVQVLTDDSRVVLSLSSAQEVTTWLKFFREFLRGSGAYIRSACHAGTFKKNKWTCCGQNTQDAAPCSKAHTALALNSFSLALSESERMHALYAILVSLLPRLQELQGRASRVTKGIQQLLLQKPRVSRRRASWAHSGLIRA